MHIDVKNRIWNDSQDLIKPGKKETNKFLINKNNFIDLMIYVTRYVNYKPIKIPSLCFHELMGKIKEHKG